MDDDSLQFDDRNLVGSLDRFVVNVGLAVLAVVPTLLILLVKPWKAGPMLAGDDRNGRRGLLLGPGVFFVAALVLAFAIAGAVPDGGDAPSAVAEPSAAAQEIEDPTVAEDQTTPDADEDDERGGRSRNVLNALAEGDIQRVATLLSPFYIFCILLAAAAAAIGRFAGPEWTLRAALGASLYVGTCILLFLLLLVFGLEWLDPELPDGMRPAGLGGVIGVFGAAPLLVVWQMAGMLRARTGAEWSMCVGMSSGMTFAMLGSTIIFSLAMALTGAMPAPDEDTVEIETVDKTPVGDTE